jgi:hypothetical protein
MSKPAIIMGYVCDQNEPSEPFPSLYDIPDDKEERHEMLSGLFSEVFPGGLCESAVRFADDLVLDESPRYCDLSFGDGDTFLLVTFLEPQA